MQRASALTFELSGDFGRDITYTIAWALYALGLLSVTLLKLFSSTTWRGWRSFTASALIAVAVIAILASFLYQRLFARAARGDGDRVKDGAVSDFSAETVKAFSVAAPGRCH